MPTQAGVVITPIHMVSVCKVDGGRACCAFLGLYDCPMCVKGTEMESDIRRQLAKGRRLDCFGEGDNCSGAPDFTPTV